MPGGRLRRVGIFEEHVIAENIHLARPHQLRRNSPSAGVHNKLAVLWYVAPNRRVGQIEPPPMLGIVVTCVQTWRLKAVGNPLFERLNPPFAEYVANTDRALFPILPNDCRVDCHLSATMHGQS